MKLLDKEGLEYYTGKVKGTLTNYYTKTETNTLLGNKENISNKVTSISSSSTDTQYPSAKCVYDSQATQDTKITNLENQVFGDETIESEGTSLTLDGTLKGQFNSIDLKGNTSQDGTPTPTSPIPVNVVSGDNDIVVSSANMLDISQLQTQTISGVTITNNGDGSITMNGTSTSGITLNIPITPVLLGANKTYTFAKKQAIGSAAYAISLRQQDSASVANSSIDSGLVSVNITPTSNVSAYYMRIYIVASRTLSNHTFFPLLKEGSTVSESDYVKFNGLNTYNIDLPIENLFDKDNATYKNNYIKNDSGQETSSGLSGYTTSYTDVKPSTTYTISGNFAGTNGMRVYFYDISKQWISRTDLNTEMPYTFTTPSNCYYIQFQYTISVYDEDEVQLELGSKANTYTPYGTTPIELCKIPNTDYEDKFRHDKVNDIWYKDEIVKKVIFKGDEDWFNEGGSAPYTLIVSDLQMPTSNNEKAPIITDMFQTVTYNSTWANYNSLVTSNQIDASSKKMKFRYADLQEVWSSWLITHNITVRYAKSSLTSIPITYQPLIDQLNLLEQAQSKENQTNISQVNNDLPFIISASAFLNNINGKIALLNKLTEV